MSVRAGSKNKKVKIKSYSSKAEYLDDLRRVLRDDYNTDVSEADLQEIARNLDVFLHALI